MINKFRNLLLFFLIFSISILSYNSQRVYALDGRTYVTIAEASAAAAACAETGATVALAPQIAIALVIGAAAYGGYKLVSTYGDDVSSFISSSLKKLSHKDVNNYFYKTGNTVSLSNEGLAWSKNTIKTNYVDNTDKVVSVPKPDGVVQGSNPFVYEGYTMQRVPYQADESPSYQTIGTIPAGDTISFVLTLDGSNHFMQKGWIKEITSSTYTIPMNYRTSTYNYNGDTVTVVQYSSSLEPDDWTDYFNTKKIFGTTTNTYSFFGYKTSTGTVTLPGTSIFVETGSSLEVGKTISLPVTDSELDGITISSTELNPVNVSKEDFQISDSVSEGDTDTSPDDNTNTSPDLDLDVPNKDIPKLDFSPLMIATQKFPFCIPWDLWTSYKVFEGNSVPFSYEFKEVSLNGAITNGQSILLIPNFKVDFSEYPIIDNAVQVFKYLQLLLFVVMLILKTRTLIRG